MHRLTINIQIAKELTVMIIDTMVVGVDADLIDFLAELESVDDLAGRLIAAVERDVAQIKMYLGLSLVIVNQFSVVLFPVVDVCVRVAVSAIL